MVSNDGLPAILGTFVPLKDYPENLQTELIERRLLASLPVIEGLDGVSLSDELRLQVYRKTTAQKRRAFVNLHGDPFGCEANESDNQVVTFLPMLVVGA